MEVIYMPKRKTLDEIKKCLFEKYGNQIEVASTEYINGRTPMQFKCACGNIFTRKYSKVIGGQITCIECTRNHMRNLFKHSDDEVLQIIKDAGCEYIAGDYENGKSILTYRCKCGNIFSRSFRKFALGQNRCKECSMKSIADAHRKYSIDDAKQILSEYGYTLLEDEFRGAHLKHKCLCENGHECMIVLNGLSSHRSGCKQCSYIKHRGENSHLFYDGRSKISDVIRHSLKEWKNKIRDQYNNTCPLTGDIGKDCDVHHLLSLRTIFDTVCAEMNIDLDINSSINQYPSIDMVYEIRDKVINLHDDNTGVLMSKKLHYKYHSIYGHRDHTPEQFDSFLKEQFGISLLDFKKGRNNYGSRIQLE